MMKKNLNNLFVFILFLFLFSCYKQEEHQIKTKIHVDTLYYQDSAFMDLIYKRNNDTIIIENYHISERKYPDNIYDIYSKKITNSCPSPNQKEVVRIIYVDDVYSIYLDSEEVYVNNYIKYGQDVQSTNEISYNHPSLVLVAETCFTNCHNNRKGKWSKIQEIDTSNLQLFKKHLFKIHKKSYIIKKNNELEKIVKKDLSEISDKNLDIIRKYLKKAVRNNDIPVY